MELSILAVVTGELSMEKFSYKPWEGISPREDVESALPYELLRVHSQRPSLEAYKDFAKGVELCLNGGLTTQRPNWPR